MQENNDLSQQLDYYRQHQHQSGWQNVVQVLFLGIQANAENADARAFAQHGRESGAATTIAPEPHRGRA